MNSVEGVAKMDVIVTCGRCGKELEAILHRGRWNRDCMEPSELEVCLCGCQDQPGNIRDIRDMIVEAVASGILPKVIGDASLFTKGKVKMMIALWPRREEGGA